RLAGKLYSTVGRILSVLVHNPARHLQSRSHASTNISDERHSRRGYGRAGTARVGPESGARAPAAPARPIGDIPAAAVAAGQGPAPVAPEKLRRIGIMTLDYNSVLKLPWDTTSHPAKTLALFDLPRFYVENYGVTNIELQTSHLAQGTSDPDHEFFREFKSKLDAAGVHANQINLEIGQITHLHTT